MAIEATGYRPADGSRTPRSACTASHATASPTTKPIESSRATSQSASSRPNDGFWMASMQPMMSRIAIGSLMPDSPSSARASRRRSVVPRRTANTAAASVAATVEPSSMASSAVRSRIRPATTAVTAAVSTVPTVARAIEVHSTGRISLKPLERPPSNRISASAMIPIWRASSKSSKSIQPSPSEPISMPRPSTSTRPGIRTDRRPATPPGRPPGAAR